MGIEAVSSWGTLSSLHNANRALMLTYTDRMYRACSYSIHERINLRSKYRENMVAIHIAALPYFYCGIASDVCGPYKVR